MDEIHDITEFFTSKFELLVSYADHIVGVKYEYDPRSLWRDIVVGADRTINEFQTGLNRAVGLNQDHLWFFGTDQDYWDSDVQDKRPGEIGQSSGGLMRGGETTLGQMVRQLELEERDRICYYRQSVAQSPWLRKSHPQGGRRTGNAESRQRRRPGGT